MVASRGADRRREMDAQVTDAAMLAYAVVLARRGRDGPPLLEAVLDPVGDFDRRPCAAIRQ